MKILKEKWEIKDLIKKQTSIDPKPQYQRTAVWTTDRKAFLIDSILKGYDLPKFYFEFHSKKNAKGFQFEVADGQQRIRSIWEFYEDKYSLKKNTVINGVDLSSMKYSELPKNLKEHFLAYEINVSNILSKEVGEVNDLFTRLQKGVSLNPPELRHAMISKIGLHIDKYVVNQQTTGFFSIPTSIKDIRFKHQDYIDHIIALSHFKYSKDLKAATITQLYLDFEEKDTATFISYFNNASIVLDKMKEINSLKRGIFKNKWAFVDTFWLLLQKIEKTPTLDSEKFASHFGLFESDRLKFNSNPEKVLKLKRNQFGKLLFDYIQAFNKEGANKGNIKTRAEVFEKVFKSLF